MFPGGAGEWSRWRETEADEIMKSVDSKLIIDADIFYIVDTDGSVRFPAQKMIFDVTGYNDHDMADADVKASCEKFCKKVEEVYSALPKSGWTPAMKDGIPVEAKMVTRFVSGSKTAAGESSDADEIYQVVENVPVFPGGTYALMKYINGEIEYPEEARNVNAQGRAVVRFVVEKDGSVTDVKIVRSTDNEYLDAEALRIVANMPKWTPGTQNGKPVRVRFNLPVMFKLSKK